MSTAPRPSTSCGRSIVAIVQRDPAVRHLDRRDTAAGRPLPHRDAGGEGRRIAVTDRRNGCRDGGWAGRRRCRCRCGPGRGSRRRPWLSALASLLPRRRERRLASRSVPESRSVPASRWPRPSGSRTAAMTPPTGPSEPRPIRTTASTRATASPAATSIPPGRPLRMTIPRGGAAGRWAERATASHSSRTRFDRDGSISSPPALRAPD